MPIGLHLEEETGDSSENGALYRMCYPRGISTRAEADTPGQDLDGGGASPSGSASQSSLGRRGRGSHAPPTPGAGSSVAAPSSSTSTGIGEPAHIDPNQNPLRAGTSTKIGSPAVALESGAADSGVVAPVQVDAQRPVTCLQQGISKPKTYTWF